MLPSGVIFALKVPDVEELLRRNLIPDDLRQIALKFGASSVRPETMDGDALEKLLRFMRGLVANSLRYVWEGTVEPFADWQTFRPELVKPACWAPVALTLSDLEEGSIDGDDYAALQGIVSREWSPAQITAMSMRDRGMLSPGEADQVIDDERKQTVPEWKSFRGERRGAAAGGASGEVERHADKPARSGKRARSRSSVLPE